MKNITFNKLKSEECMCSTHLREHPKDGPCLGHGDTCPCVRIKKEEVEKKRDHEQ